MSKNCIVAQSGGPTSAINASLAGVMDECRKSGCYDKIYGAIHGIQGVMERNFIELNALCNDQDIDDLSHTPTMYIGSCRYKLPDVDAEPEAYEKLFGIFEEMNIGAFFYIGGNDSMDTVAKLSAYAEKVGSEIRFAGVPKTIDNDLMGTDHTPGYGSAAKFIATSMLEISYDTYIYNAPCVTIVEIMGRNAGWLTAAAALSRNDYINTPQLVYLPEAVFDMDTFIEDVRECLKQSRNVVVAVSEGIHDKDGNYISAVAAKEDKFGHAQLSGVGKTLELEVKERLGVKCRSIEFNILQRCAGHIASATDINESMMLGRAAVKLTAMGHTGFMTALKRYEGEEEYSCYVDEAKLSEVANKEKQVPAEWINEKGNNVTDELIEYIKPLIKGEITVGYKDGLPAYLPIPHLTDH